MEWFDVHAQGPTASRKKTMGLELAEQFGFDDLPDVIMYPTGGGTGLIGMWKAFAELKELGLISEGTSFPRWSPSATGCAPMVNAFEAGEEFATRVDDAYTRARWASVPAAVGDFLVLRAARVRGGPSPWTTTPRRGRRGVLKDGVPPLPRGRGDVRGVQEGTRRGKSQRPIGAPLQLHTGSSPMPLSNNDIDRHQPIDYDEIAKGI